MGRPERVLKSSIPLDKEVIVRKDEARTKLCPLRMTLPDQPQFCHLDDCMLWRKAHSFLECPTCQRLPGPEYAEMSCAVCSTPFDAIETGYCGLAK
jgi:hypothetical protein